MNARLAITALSALVLVQCKKSEDSAADAAAAASATPPASASATPPPPPPSTTFEGEIDVNATGTDGKPPEALTLLVHDDKVRLDSIPGGETAQMFGGPAWVLLRIPDKKVDVVVDSQKKAVELDLGNAETLKHLTERGKAAAKKEKEAETDPPKITKTGKKDTVAGHECEDWEIRPAHEHKKKTVMCVTELETKFFNVPGAGLPAEYGFASELADGKHFPIRIVQFDEKGNESGRLEVTKLDPKPEDASKFAVPDGYTTVDLMQMLGSMGMGNMPGIPSGMPNIPGPPGKHHHKHH